MVNLPIVPGEETIISMNGPILSPNGQYGFCTVSVRNSTGQSRVIGYYSTDCGRIWTQFNYDFQHLNPDLLKKINEEDWEQLW